jgi:protein arginine N-methyltransferase 1
MCVWFDAELGQGIGFSNRPGLESAIYGKAFFPWPEAVTLKTGDRVVFRLLANLVDGDYVWRWETRLPGGKHFSQSTFFASLFSPATLRKKAASFVPTLGEAGCIDLEILGMMAGNATLGEIAEQLFACHRTKFNNIAEALDRVARLSEMYAEIRDC